MNFLTRLALKKTWVTYLLTAILAGACIWATLSLKMELIPDIELPMTTIVTIYPQAQPEDVMNDVTIPIESAIAGMKGLRHIESTSRESVSYVFAEFDYGVGMARVNATITDLLAEMELPAEVRDLPSVSPQMGPNPRVVPIDINMMPVITLSLLGDLPAGELAQIAQTQIVPEMEKLGGVFSVSVQGSGDKVLVSPSLDKLEQYGVSVGQLAGALAAQQYTSVADVENASLSPAGPALKQVADVRLGPAPGSTIHRTNGLPSVTISVTKTAEANTVITANNVTDKVAELREILPAGVDLVTVTDQSEYIEQSVADLRDNALIGGGLAIIVVFLFLMAFRASIITSISIPMSVLIGFLLMNFAGITSNILTLSAMVLAIGRVIDDSIVITEVTYRRMQAGEKFPQAALNGTREVSTAVIASSISTVVIFLPLAFVGGIVGEMFVPFALTITFAMVGSLVSALTIVPALSRFLTVKKLDDEVTSNRWYQRVYTPTLKWCLAHRGATLAVAILLFIGSLGLMPVIGTSFMPELNSNVVTAVITLPKDSPASAMDTAARKAEAIIAADDRVLVYTTSLGSSAFGGSVMEAMAGGGGGGVGSSAEIVILVDSSIKSQAFADILQGKLDGVTAAGAVDVSPMQAMTSGSGSRLEISVRGDTLQDINDAAAQLQNHMSGMDGIGDQELVFGKTQPRLIIAPDPVKMAAAGLTPDALQQMQPELLLLRQGGTVAQAAINGDTYDVYLLGVAQQATTLEAVQDLKVGFTRTVTLGDIANIQLAMQTTEVRRIDRKLAASLIAEITATDVGAVTAAVQREIRQVQLPAGVEISTGGIAEDMQESFQRMYYAILVAIVLAYFVLVVTFRGFRKPLIIMVSLPLASVGAMIGLLVTGHTLGVTGLMGVLMLVGIVLTNAVVLLAFVGQLQKGGLSVNDALIRGGQTRLRPILMTALTTLIAMLPLAFGIGEGVLMAAELAVVVVGGLFSSTLLTLLVVPVIYSMAYRKHDRAPVGK